MNPMVNLEMPANLDALQARFSLNSFGQTVAHLPREIQLETVTDEEIIQANASVQLPSCYGGEIFCADSGLASPEEIYASGLTGFSGVHLSHTGRVVPTVRLGHAWQVVTVRFLVAPRADAARNLINTHPIFRPRADGRVIVPLVGDIHCLGSDLNEDQLRTIGMEFLKDAAGQHLNALAFAMGLRSVFFPTRLGLGIGPGSSGVLGWQFKGVGEKRYVFHFCAVRPDGLVLLQSPSDVILQGAATQGYDGAMSQRREYAGRSGMFWDLFHQPHRSAPVGATYESADAIRHHRALAASGCALGRVITEVAEIGSRRTLSRISDRHRQALQVPNLEVPCEVWIGQTTLRMNIVAVSTMASEIQDRSLAFANVLDIEFGSIETPAAKEKLRRVAQQCGMILSSCLNARLTLPADQFTDGNITMLGEALDYGDYVVAPWWGWNASLVFRFLIDLHAFAAGARMDTRMFFREATGRAFLSEFLDAEQVDGLLEIAPLYFAQGGSPLAVNSADYRVEGKKFAIKVATLWVLRTLSTIRGLKARYIPPSSLFSALEKIGFRAEIASIRSTEGVGDNAAQKLAEAAERMLPTYVGFLLDKNFVMRTNQKSLMQKPPTAELA